MKKPNLFKCEYKGNLNLFLIVLERDKSRTSRIYLFEPVRSCFADKGDKPAEKSTKIVGRLRTTLGECEIYQILTDVPRRQQFVLGKSKLILPSEL